MSAGAEIAADLQVVALGGGAGTRFWPASRRQKPKHLLSVAGEETLLAATFARIEALSGPESWWMVVGRRHAELCRRAVPSLPQARVLVEPAPRNTAAAIALAALHVQRRAPEAVMVVLPADHTVTDPAALRRALALAATPARDGRIVTLGITPDSPETGYGYIRRGGPDGSTAGVFHVDRFLEKPSRSRAEQLLADGSYVWNAGILVVRPVTLLEEIERQMPELHRAVSLLRDAIDTPAYPGLLAELYAGLPSVSIDYGVMEGAADVRVVPVDCGWSDVGSWNALSSLLPADERGNVVRGKAVVVDSTNTVVYAGDGHVVGVVGVEGLVVVHTADATLVVPRDRAQEVRAVIAEIESRGWKEYL